MTEVFYSDVVDRAGKMAAINDDIRAEWDIIDGGKIG